MVRGKFRLSEVISYAGCTQQKFKFSAVQDSTIPENTQYAKYTPSGAIEINVDNPPAQEQFKVGEYYYVDFTPVPVPEAK